MFGLGFSEMIIIGIVLLVVVGPKELPKLLRTVGQGIRKLRGLSTELRQQSGIDEIIRDEGLREDLEAIRSLSRGRVVESLVREASRPAPRRQPGVLPLEALERPEGAAPERDAEYPVIGPDSYGALSEDAPVEAALAGAEAGPVVYEPPAERAANPSNGSALAASTEPAAAERAATPEEG